MSLRLVLPMCLALGAPSLARPLPAPASVSLSDAARREVEAEVRAQMARRAIPGLQVVGEEELNDWGGRLLGAGRIGEAVAVFALNTRLRPASFNTWDSLGEALEAQRRPEDAEAAYRRSLDLDRSNDHARARLAALVAARR